MLKKYGALINMSASTNLQEIESLLGMVESSYGSTETRNWLTSRMLPALQLLLIDQTYGGERQREEARGAWECSLTAALRAYQAWKSAPADVSTLENNQLRQALAALEEHDQVLQFKMQKILDPSTVYKHSGPGFSAAELFDGKAYLCPTYIATLTY